MGEEKLADKKQDAVQKEDLNDLMRVRREKMEKFREMGVAPFGHRYEVTHHAQEVLDTFARSQPYSWPISIGPWIILPSRSL